MRAISLWCGVGLAISLMWQMSVANGQEAIVIRPRTAPGPLDNPLKGWCPYTNAGEIHQPYSLVFKYVSWRELEPSQGDYRFAEWEESWQVPRAKGKHIVFRVYVDYPAKKSGLPEWLRKAGVKESPYKDYGGGMSPDYNDPRMIAGLERLIAALGKRYNSHPRIAFIQLGLLGFWGEWHTYPRTKLYASPATERRIVAAYRKAFPDKQLMVRYARGYAGQQNWIGFHDDMFPQDTDNGQDWSFLAGVRNAGRTTNWQRAVVGGEMVPNQARQWLGQDFATTQTMLNRAHFTWVGPYCPALNRPPNKTFAQRSSELVRKMGYEFQLNQVTLPAKMSAKQSARFSVKGTNRGVAPFYYPWSVEWALLDDDGKLVKLFKTDWDLRIWQPGPFTAQAKVRFDVPAGVYRVGLGIRDPWQNRPAIRFANDLPVVGGWTILSQLKIVP